MNSSMTTIQVSVETAEVLKMIQAEADARQLPLDVYLRTLAERVNGAAEPTAELSSQEKVRLFREWAAGLDPNTPVVLDDSREAIYADGEKPFYETASAEEWVKALHAWVESHKGRNYGFVDDSRESIYREREDRQL
jgi:hypothetical protein